MPFAGLQREFLQQRGVFIGHQSSEAYSNYQRHQKMAIAKANRKTECSDWRRHSACILVKWLRGSSCRSAMTNIAPAAQAIAASDVVSRATLRSNPCRGRQRPHKRRRWLLQMVKTNRRGFARFLSCRSHSQALGEFDRDNGQHCHKGDPFAVQQRYFRWRREFRDTVEQGPTAMASLKRQTARLRHFALPAAPALASTALAQRIECAAPSENPVTAGKDNLRFAHASSINPKDQGGNRTPIPKGHHRRR